MPIFHSVKWWPASVGRGGVLCIPVCTKCVCCNGGDDGPLIAAPTLFIGLNLHKAFVPWWATWVLVAFMLFHLIIELMLEIHGCLNSRKQECKSA